MGGGGKELFLGKGGTIYFFYFFFRGRGSWEIEVGDLGGALGWRVYQGRGGRGAKTTVSRKTYTGRQ